MFNPQISIKTYLTIALVFTILFFASVAIIGSPVFNWIFAMIAIATAFIAIFQSMVNQSRA